jgi:hypothetical protein
MPSAEFITDYVKRMYSNWNQPFDPYTWIKWGGIYARTL